MSLLDQYLLTLSDAQREAIQNLLDEKRQSGEIKSEDEFAEELQKRLDQLVEEHPRPTMQLRPQGEKISSAAYNDTMEEIFVDLHALFVHSSVLDRSIYDHHRLNLSVLNSVTNEIKKLEDKIDRYLLMLENNNEIVIPVFQSLKDMSSFTSQRHLYGGALQVSVDPDVGAMTLPALSSHDQLRSPNGSIMADIRVNQQLGMSIDSVNKKYGPSNAIDGSDSTFWGEVVLSDTPIKNYFNGELIEGAAISFDIILDYTAPVSKLSFNPYTEFPLDIVRIELYEDLSSTEPVLVLVGEDGLNPPFATDQPFAFQFGTVVCQRVRFILNQQHYVLNSYYLRKSEVEQAELWERISNHELTNLGYTYGVLDQDMQNSLMGWHIYRDAMKIWASERSLEDGDPAVKDLAAANMTLPGTQLFTEEGARRLGAEVNAEDLDEVTQVTKYEYVYGAYDIGLGLHSYAPEGTYISSPINVDGNVKQVFIETEEEHPIIEIAEDDGSISRIPATSVEWFVTNNQEWFPILPTLTNGQPVDFVMGERLEINEFGEGATRFPINKSRLDEVEVRENGKRLPEGAYEVIEALGSSDLMIAISEYNSSFIYTVSYPVDTSDPLRSGFTVDFQAKGVTPTLITEAFPAEKSSSHTRQVELSYYPFVNYETVYSGSEANYQPIKVTMQGDFSSYDIDRTLVTMSSGSASNPLPHLVNVTDYAEGIQPLLTPYNSNTKRFEFRQRGKKLIFGDPLFNADITVEYSYLVKDIRIKAILRRNIPGHESLTPFIRSYTAKMKTINMY